VFKPDVKVGSLERNHGERKQKKRDQNKSAAHRYCSHFHFFFFKSGEDK